MCESEVRGGGLDGEDVGGVLGVTTSMQGRSSGTGLMSSELTELVVRLTDINRIAELDKIITCIQKYVVVPPTRTPSLPNAEQCDTLPTPSSYVDA